MPSDAQIQTVFGLSCDRLRPIEYGASRGFATASDVGNARKMVVTGSGGISVGVVTKAQEGVGRRGTIIGGQTIGLLDASHPGRPEIVPAGQQVVPLP